MMTRVRLTLRHTLSATMVLLISAGGLSAGCAMRVDRASHLRQLATRNDLVVPGSWDEVATLQPPAPLVVTLKSSDRVTGAFHSLSADVLTLSPSKGKQISIARSNVARIVTRSARDSLTNGILIGAGIGLGAALAILAVAGSGEGYVLPSAKRGAPLLLSGIGALVGGFIDRAHRGEQVIFIA